MGNKVWRAYTYLTDRRTWIVGGFGGFPSSIPMHEIEAYLRLYEDDKELWPEIADLLIVCDIEYIKIQAEKNREKSNGDQGRNRTDHRPPRGRARRAKI